MFATVPKISGCRDLRRECAARFWFCDRMVTAGSDEKTGRSVVFDVRLYSDATASGVLQRGLRGFRPRAYNNDCRYGVSDENHTAVHDGG
jgi:hypothetical protein